jgi:hypothetical protein
MQGVSAYHWTDVGLLNILSPTWVSQQSVTKIISVAKTNFGHT